FTYSCFPAEAGIRDATVTGVQTCALPISRMPRYRVTLRHTSVEIVDADNPYQAAIAARDLHDDSIEVSDVVPARGRPASSQRAEIGRASCRARIAVAVVRAGRVERR